MEIIHGGPVAQQKFTPGVKYICIKDTTLTDLYEVDEPCEVIVLGPQRPFVRRLDALLLSRVQDPHKAPGLWVTWNQFCQLYLDVCNSP